MRLAALCACILLGCTSALPAAQLGGWIDVQPAGVNLTSEGTRDWIQGGFNGDYTKLNRKTGVGLISPLTVATPGNNGALARGGEATLTWSDGSPDATFAGTNAGIHAHGIGNSVRFTVPADTTARTIRVCFFSVHAVVKVTAHLSDTSAPYWVDDSWYATTGTIASVATLSFAAASANQTLYVTVACVSGNDLPSVGIHAVTLRAGATPIPPPPAPPAPTGVHAFACNVRVALNWNQMARIDSYNIYRSNTSSHSTTPWRSGILPIAGNVATQMLAVADAAATNGSTWHYWVSSVNAGGETLAAEVTAAPLDPGSTAIGTGRVLNIMPMGDSITFGFPVNNGYRKRLLDALAAGGYQVHMVGGVRSNSNGMDEPYHEGWPSQRVEYLRDVMAERALPVYRPDLILLMIGTNNLAWGGKTQADVDNALTAYDGLLARIAQLAPASAIIVAPILPIQGTDLPTGFNAALQAKVTALAAQGRRIFWCAQMSGITVAQLPDGIHPGAQAYSTMGDSWYAAIQAIASTSARPSPSEVKSQFGRSGTAITMRVCDVNGDDRVDAADLGLAVRAATP